MIGTKAKVLSIVFKCIVIVSSAVGIILSAIAGAQSFMGGGRVFMYFTVQSNIAIALVCAVGAVLLLRNQPIQDIWYLIKFVFTVSITLTGVVKKRSVFFVIIPPLLYAIYTGIAYVAKWEFSRGVHYPYFFLNWGSPAGAFGFTNDLPYMGCAWWILLILVMLLAVGYGYLLALDLLKRRSRG